MKLETSLLADSRETGDDPVVELVIAELADAILRFAMLEIALDFFLTLNARIGLVGFRGARRERRREYEGQDEEKRVTVNKSGLFAAMFLSFGL